MAAARPLHTKEPRQPAFRPWLVGGTRQVNVDLGNQGISIKLRKAFKPWLRHSSALDNPHRHRCGFVDLSIIIGELPQKSWLRRAQKHRVLSSQDGAGSVHTWFMLVKLLERVGRLVYDVTRQTGNTIYHVVPPGVCGPID